MSLDLCSLYAMLMSRSFGGVDNQTAKSSAANGTQNTELKAEVRKLKESLAVKERDLSESLFPCSCSNLPDSSPAGVRNMIGVEADDWVW